MIAHEVLKNLVLAGIGHIYLYDDSEEEKEENTREKYSQLNYCLFFNEDHQGRTATLKERFLELRRKLALLNPAVMIETTCSVNDMRQCDIVADCSFRLEEALDWNALARQLNVKYYWSCMNTATTSSQEESNTGKGSFIGWNFCDFLSNYAFFWFHAATDKKTDELPEKLAFLSLQEFTEKATHFINIQYKDLSEKEKKRGLAFHKILYFVLSKVFHRPLCSSFPEL